jgi:hypothetical protein
MSERQSFWERGLFSYWLVVAAQSIGHFRAFSNLSKKIDYIQPFL